MADKYWNARGGSHTDGGTFIFNLKKDPAGKIRITCTDKFGTAVSMPAGTEACDFSQDLALSCESEEEIQTIVGERFAPSGVFSIFEMMRELIPQWTFDEFRLACRQIIKMATDASKTEIAIEVFTLLNDRRYSTGSKKRSHILHIIRSELNRLFKNIPNIGSKEPYKGTLRLIDFETRVKPQRA